VLRCEPCTFDFYEVCKDHLRLTAIFSFNIGIMIKGAHLRHFHGFLSPCADPTFQVLIANQDSDDEREHETVFEQKRQEQELKSFCKN